MPSFRHGDVEIAYLDEGAGEPILLIHGFASNVATNWVDTGWVKLLSGAGYRVVAYDNRGHGKSAKLYSTEDYGAPNQRTTSGTTMAVTMRTTPSTMNVTVSRRRSPSSGAGSEGGLPAEFVTGRKSG